MRSSRNLRIAVMAAGVLLLAGCVRSQLSSPASVGDTASSTTTTPPPSATPPPATPQRITYPSIFVTDYDTTPNTVVVLQQPPNSSPTTVWRFPGVSPAVD